MLQRRRLTFAFGSLALTLAACGPSTRDDNGADADENTDEDEECTPIAQFETCGGGVDDDCDGDTDCDDPDCAEADLCDTSGPTCGSIDTPVGSLVMPDGVGCTSGGEQLGSNASTGCETYDSVISIEGFSDGQIMEAATDIISVCANMEHSWIPDVQVELHCPDGVSIPLIEFLGRNNSGYLGVPNDSDDPNLPGTGWDYCFVPGASNAPILNYIAENHPQTVPAGDYRPSGDFSEFVGCALNGDWMLQGQDRWGADNGFVFSWQINFNPEIIEDCEDWPID
jgi:subtilisin-like proprotein convertase family protein